MLSKAANFHPPRNLKFQISNTHTTITTPSPAGDANCGVPPIPPDLQQGCELPSATKSQISNLKYTHHDPGHPDVSNMHHLPNIGNIEFYI